MRTLKVILFCSGLFFTAFNVLGQTQVTIDIVEDVSVYYKESYDAENQNYSTGVNVKVGTGTSGGYPTKNRVYMKLDLSSIPSNGIVTDAYLDLYSLQAQSTSDNKVWLRKVTVPWDHTEITWNNQPFATLEPNFQTTDPFIPSGGAGSIQVDITDWIAGAVSSGQSDFSFLMHLETETAGQYRSQKFASNENTTVSYRPKLVITYEEPPVYYHVQEKLSGAYAIVQDGVLRLRLDNNYYSNSSSVSLKITDQGGGQVYNSAVLVNTGINNIEIDLSSAGGFTNGEYYLVQYTGLKGKKSYLRFKYE